jgi:RHS repeat-associated protein
MTKAGTNSLAWDENGNMTVGIGTTLAYNWDNKLRSATEGTKSISVKYDPDGNRIWKESTVSGQTVERKYIVDVVGDLPVILMEINPADSSIVKSYIHANAQIFAKRDGGQAGTRYFYLHDRLGSVRQVINSSGSVVKYSTFEPFGESIESGGTFDDPFGFTGQYFDAEIGEYHLRARQYNPTLARFTARDPVFGDFGAPLSLHKYLYCQNEPINRIDPSGLLYFDQNFTYTPIGIGPGISSGAKYGYGLTTGNPWGAVAGGIVGGFAGGVGGTAGFTYERTPRTEATKFHIYAGPAWSTRWTRGMDSSTSMGFGEVKTGWNLAYALSGKGAYYQHGLNFGQGETTEFREFGTASRPGFGFSLSFFYVFTALETGPKYENLDPVSYFQNELDDLTKAVMMGEMLQETGSLIGTNQAGIAFYANALYTARMLGM